MSCAAIHQNRSLRALPRVVALLVGAVRDGAGSWLAPRLVRSALIEDIPKSSGRDAQRWGISASIPFLLQLEVKDFALAAPSGEKLLGFERLFVDFELSSIWHRAYSFANIDIDAPFVNAVGRARMER